MSKAISRTTQLSSVDTIQYAGQIYKSSTTTETQDAVPSAAADVDAEIEKELTEMRQPSSEELFTSIRLDTQCRQSPYSVTFLAK
jgi:hypothetical protein